MMESDKISVDMKVICLQHIIQTWVAQTENVGVFALDPA
jgi:hypothetical protein